jgi:ankyrin repeat protein
MTALMYACFNGHIDVVKLLIKHKVNMNVKRNYDGKTALMYAVQEEHYEITKLLIENGCDIFSMCLDGKSALNIGLLLNREEIIELLLFHYPIDYKFKNGKSLLHLAVLYKNIYAVKLLLKNGFDINIHDNNGNSPLFYAFYVNSYKIINLLIEHSSENIKDMLYSYNHYENYDFDEPYFHLPYIFKNTPLFMKVIYLGNIKIIEQCIKYEIDLNYMTSSYLYPLCIAYNLGHFKILEYLVENGADILKEHSETLSISNLAVEHNNIPVIKMIKRLQPIRDAAIFGDIELFKDSIIHGYYPAPVPQWLPYLPELNKQEFIKWIKELIFDEINCFIIFYKSNIKNKLSVIQKLKDFDDMRRLTLKYLIHPKQVLDLVKEFKKRFIKY